MKTQINSIFTLLFLTLLASCSPSTNESENSKTGAASETASDNEFVNAAFPYKFEKVADNTWIMHGPRELPNPENRGFMNNPGIVLTTAGIVVIDPGSTVHVGNDVLAEIRQVSEQPIVAVFNTHIHGDHWLGNQAIRAAYPDVKIYGHEKMISSVEAGEGERWLQTMSTLTEGASDGTVVIAPDNAVINDEMITIGETNFKIHNYGVAHTKTDIMIEVVEESVIFLGDNVLALRIPRTSDGTFMGNINSVNTILESSAQVYVPGHGPTGDRAMVEKYVNYLSLIYEAAQQVFRDDLDSSDVIAITKVTTKEYKDWYGYDELLGPQGAQAYSEVEAAEF